MSGLVKLIGTFVYTEIFTICSKRMFKFSAVFRGTERSGTCLLAEADIDHMLLLLQTLKVVQLHALLVQTNPSWLYGSSESSWVFCCMQCCCVLLLLYDCFWGLEEVFSPGSSFWSWGEGYKHFCRKGPTASPWRLGTRCQTEEQDPELTQILAASRICSSRQCPWLLLSITSM